MANPVEWKTSWLVVAEGGKRRIPAFEFLTGLVQDDLEAVSDRLLQILESVKLCGGPHHWSDTSSHDKMEGELDDLHEVRDKHGEMLYRLYLKWEKDTMTVWILDGRSKPNKTALPEADYKEIRKLGDIVIKQTDQPPEATADDFAKSALKKQKAGE